MGPPAGVQFPEVWPQYLKYAACSRCGAVFCCAECANAGGLVGGESDTLEPVLDRECCASSRVDQAFVSLSKEIAPAVRLAGRVLARYVTRWCQAKERSSEVETPYLIATPCLYFGNGAECDDLGVWGNWATTTHENVSQSDDGEAVVAVSEFDLIFATLQGALTHPCKSTCDQLLSRALFRAVVARAALNSMHVKTQSPFTEYYGECHCS